LRKVMVAYRTTGFIPNVQIDYGTHTICQSAFPDFTVLWNCLNILLWCFTGDENNELSFWC